jgi:lactate dehydrogenase-like 2-hydroxyacid dehydrogenase
MLDLLGLGEIGTTVAMVLAAFGAIWAALWRAGKQGEQKAKDKANADTLERIQRGNDAINRNADPADRLRRNYGRW